jgi:hypothetical protein
MVKCLGCKISYGNDKDIQQQVAKFTQILGILNSAFKNKFGSEIFIYKV